MIKTGINQLVGITAFMVCTSLSTYAQETSFDKNLKQCIPDNREKLNVHLNKHVFVSGETLHYSIYAFTNSQKASDIIYFALFDIHNQPVFHWRTSVLNDSKHGQITLPDTLSTGLYTLVGYSNFMRNFDSQLLMRKSLVITKINEKNPDTIEIPGDLQTSKAQHIRSNKSPIHIKLLKDNYVAGEMIRVTLQLPDQKDTDSSCISVSVNEKTPFDPWLYASNETENKQAISNIILSNPPYYPKEMGVFTVAGKVMKRSNQQPIKNAMISASYKDTTPHFTYAYTNANGEFCLLLDQHFENKIPVFQLHNTSFNAYEVGWEIDQKLPVDVEVTNNPESYALTIKQREYLDKLRKAELVDRIYSKDHYHDDKATQEHDAFPIKPNQIVYPNDYESLKNFAEIASNIIYGVRFGKKNEEYRLSMVMSESQVVYDQGAMIFVDGIPFTNLDYIASLGTEDIQRIEVSNHEYMYGDLTFYGVLSIYTHHQEINPSSYGNPYYLFDNQVNSISSTTKRVDEGGELPLINPHVYWNPFITLVGSKKIEMEFKAPALSSDYMIRVEGISTSGNPILKTTEFKIE